MRSLRVVLAAAVLAAVAASCGSPIAQTVQPLVTIQWHGGLCPEGECSRMMVIRTDGVIEDANLGEGSVRADPAAFTRLRATISETDLRSLAGKPFTGTCPTAFDGQEVVFTFRVPSGDFRLASCEVELNPEHPLFQAIQEVLRAAEGPSN